MSGLFQEKQAELQAAVLRVEQLSLQLEDLRRGKLNGVPTALGGHVTGAAALELRKLYQELQVLHGTHTAPTASSPILARNHVKGLHAFFAASFAHPKTDF